MNNFYKKILIVCLNLLCLLLLISLFSSYITKIKSNNIRIILDNILIKSNNILLFSFFDRIERNSIKIRIEGNEKTILFERKIFGKQTSP